MLFASCCSVAVAHIGWYFRWPQWKCLHFLADMVAVFSQLLVFLLLYYYITFADFSFPLPGHCHFQNVMLPTLRHNDNLASIFIPAVKGYYMTAMILHQSVAFLLSSDIGSEGSLGPYHPRISLAITIIKNHSLRTPMTWDFDATWNTFLKNFLIFKLKWIYW